MKLGVANVLSRRTWILACLPSVSAENHSRTDRSAKLVQMAYMGVVPKELQLVVFGLHHLTSLALPGILRLVRLRDPHGYTGWQGAQCRV